MQTLSNFHDFILCIISTLEARDSYTSHHSSRVAEMTEKICDLLNLPLDEKEVYHIAAHLHDVGKIGIRDSVLLKEGKLSQEEWEIMKSHAIQGYNILKNVKSFEEVAKIVRSHHERFDGKGYPDGLKGEEIPRLVRIISVADAYDAMTSKRSYRDVLAQEIVKEEIEKGKGKQFDPQIADVMLLLMAEDTNYKMHE